MFNKNYKKLEKAALEKGRILSVMESADIIYRSHAEAQRCRRTLIEKHPELPQFKTRIGAHKFDVKNGANGAKLCKCLSCQKDFDSEGPHNRICYNCKDTNNWRAGEYGI
jgi:hypothetical protein